MRTKLASSSMEKAGETSRMPATSHTSARRRSVDGIILRLLAAQLVLLGVYHGNGGHIDHAPDRGRWRQYMSRTTYAHQHGANGHPLANDAGHGKGDVSRILVGHDQKSGLAGQARSGGDPVSLGGL